MKASEITHTTNIAKPYLDGLRKLRTLSEFRSYISEWKEIAPDAFDKICSLNQYHFDKFMQGFAKEKRGQYAGQQFSDKFGMIILPRIIVMTGMLAQSFKVPEGTMFLRLLKDKNITRDEAGICHINEDNHTFDNVDPVTDSDP